MNCARCGHVHGMHGRRGYGACRVGRGDYLAALVGAAEACAAAGLRGEEAKRVIEATAPSDPCQCKRFRARSPAPAQQGETHEKD